MSITLEIHVCDQRRVSYPVVFEGDGPDVEARALQFVKARSSTHAIYEIEATPIPEQYGQLLDWLYPTCEHGLSASNCYGPQHYYFDEEEQARGMRNGW
jgi:hypothetical protein